MDHDIELGVQRTVITDRVRATIPVSLAAGQIPRETLMAFVAPLIEEIADLRVRVAGMESDAR